MKRYEKYKPSGVEWIGDVPEGWEVAPLKRFLSEAMKYGANAPAEEENNLFPRYIRITDIDENGKLKDDDIKSLNNNDSKDYMLEKGDLLFARSGATVGKTYLFDENYRACYAGYLIKAKCDKKLLPKFVVYYTQSSIYDNWKSASFIQSTIQNISAEKYSMLPMLFPPLEEQNAIATYLDAKCAKIDNVVAVQQKRIELLKELKQSIITHAVTRGLDKNAKMKDSGVEWIGEVPEEWEIVKTIYCLSMPITDGPHETPVLHDDGIPFISAEAVSQGFINFDLKRGYISQQYYEECCKKYTPQKHDIYMIKSGATTGRTAIVETDEIFTIWSPLAVFRSNTNIIKPYYLLYVLRSEYYQKQVENSWSYGTQQNIGMRVLEKLKIALPPLSEQTAIATYLNKKCAIIDRQIAKVEKQIELLKEYKQSVITECVTGKRKVC